MNNIVKFPTKDSSPIYSRKYAKTPDFANVISIKHGDLLRAQKACLEYMTMFGAGVRADSLIPDMLSFEQKLDFNKYSIEDK